MRAVALMAIASATAASLCVLAWVVVPQGARPAQDVGGEGPAGLVEPGEPCPGAVHGKPTALETEVRMWLPTEEWEARDAWTCGDTPVVLYGDIQVSFEEDWGDVDVAAKWEDLADDYGGTVVELDGRSALVQEAGSDEQGQQVLLVADGELVRLLARASTPIERLTELAEALRLPRD